MGSALAKMDTMGVTRTQRVAPGLFVLRYASSNGGALAPSVRVELGDAEAARILSDAAVAAPVLSEPGHGVVIEARKDTELKLTVMPRAVGCSLDAQLALERIVCNDKLGGDNLVSEAVVAGNGPSVLAHVARRGDVKVGNGTWLCGPSDPMSLEGIEIVWPTRPEGLDILVSAVVGLASRRPQPPVRIGHFAGTRQKASPLVGLTFNLTGAAAHLYSLTVDALFLGSAIVTKSGPFIELSGPTGMEPLVGLRMSVTGPEIDDRTSAVEPVTIETDPALQVPMVEAARKPGQAEASPFNRSSGIGRVRVFRAPRSSHPSPLSVD